MTLMLRPLGGGSYTQLLLLGPVPSSPVPLNLRRLLTMFSDWSGYPVDVVLSVDKQTAGWCEVWTDALCAVPARHLEVTFHRAPSFDASGSR
jgi:hypothetical protein